MLNTKVFHTLVFPWALLSRVGEIVAEGNGILFKSNSLAERLESMMHVRSAPTGWSVCPNGFAVFARPLGDGQKLVLYGLKVKGLSTHQGKSETLSINLSKSDVESYIDQIFHACSLVDEQFNEIVRGNLHEIKKLSAIIGAAAYQVRDELAAQEVPIVITARAESIVSAQELLYARLQYFDFIFNPYAVSIKLNESIQVHNKFYKALKTLEKSPNSRGVRLRMGGFSTGQIKGAKIFDIVPYVLIDNAVKYSPDSGTVEVVVEDKGNLIDVKVSSLGPKIEKEERDKIFQKGFRGNSVANSKTEGTGVGLYVVQRIIKDTLKGTLSVQQEDEVSQTSKNTEYYRTTFGFTLIANAKD